MRKQNITRSDKYRKTKKGVVTAIYGSQKQSSKKRGHLKPDYSLSELKEWIFNNPSFDFLFSNWVQSGYSKNFKPSCDRLNDYKPYTLDNLKLVTWEENRESYYKNCYNGINTKQCNPILQYNLQGNFIKEHYSIMSASRENNIHHSNIIKVLKKQRNHAGGYIWKYK